MADIIKQLLDLPNQILSLIAPTDPPMSSIFILLVAVLVSLASTLISRKMIDIEKLKRLTKEQKNYNKLRIQMMKTADKKLKLKYERNADRMRKVQSELQMMKMKPLLIMMVPMMLFFIIMSGYYRFDVETINGVVTVVGGNIPAIIPIPLPEVILFSIGKNAYVEGWGKVFVPNYVWWYFAGSLTSSSILQKVAGLQPD